MLPSASIKNTGTPLIFPYQQAAYNRLCAIARATVYCNFADLPIKPRANVFMVAPSGSGKTHLAEAVANSMGLEYLPISVSEWIVMGASQRGASCTWPAICQFLVQSSKKDGYLVFLDELDKIGRLNQGDWSRYQTTEVFSLLDRRIPKNQNDSDGDKISDAKIHDAETILNTRTLIVAGGAFQEIWDAPDPIGFGAEPGASTPMPDLNLLARYIPPELSKRFGSQIVMLPRLLETDYSEMLDRILPSLPSHWRSRYEKLARAGIPEATRLAQGPRYFEELLLEVAVQERMEISSPVSP